MSVKCLAALGQGEALKPFSYESPALGGDEVLVQISHCGICHSDIHLIDNDWGFSTYPLVPGHEIVGTVSSCGGNVKHLQPGQRVGIGWQCGACFTCSECKSGEENFCAANVPTCVGHFGGFAESVVADARFAFPIPESLSSENAAPLLCAGITVFTPLDEFAQRKKRGTKVGIIGMGGLGHLALQFASAMDFDVTLFSTSPSKEAEARSYGATNFALTNKPETLQSLVNTFDFILSTVSADIDWPTYISLLGIRGELCVVGVPPSELKIPAFSLISGRKSVSGSPIGNRKTIEKMLDFAAEHDVKAQVETAPMADANAAMKRVRENSVRYRMVLVN